MACCGAYSVLVAILVVSGSQADSTGAPETVPMPGGITPQDPASPEIQELLIDVMPVINYYVNATHPLLPVKVLSASTQVVAGIKTRMHVLVAPFIAPMEDLSKDCSPVTEKHELVYDVSIWSKPWENFKKITVHEAIAENYYSNGDHIEKYNPLK